MRTITLFALLVGCATEPSVSYKTSAESDDDSFADRRLHCEFSAGALPADTFGPSVTGTPIPIDTFVILLQENRAFDHYFSLLPSAGQPDVEVAAPDASNPDWGGDPVYR